MKRVGKFRFTTDRAKAKDPFNRAPTRWTYTLEGLERMKRQASFLRKMEQQYLQNGSSQTHYVPRVKIHSLKETRSKPHDEGG